VSPATTGGVRAQNDLKYALTSTLSVLVPHKEVLIAQAGDKIVDGRLVDQASLDHLQALLAAVVAFVKRVQPADPALSAA